MRVYYAQNREDLLIKAFFPDVVDGFYVDLGANDPELHSVTKLLYDEGWSGINVEPIESRWRALEKARPRDTNLRLGVGAAPGKLEFTEYGEGDGLSTFMAAAVEHNEHDAATVAHLDSRTYEVEVKTLNQIVTENGVEHIHVLKVDVEGYEFEALSSYAWDGLRPELICIEANHIDRDRDWRPVLESAKYELAFFDGLNNYYVASEARHRLEAFDYPAAMLSEEAVSYWALNTAFEDERRQLGETWTRVVDTERRLAERDSELQATWARVIEMEAKITELNEELQSTWQRVVHAEERVTEAEALAQQANEDLATATARLNQTQALLRGSVELSHKISRLVRQLLTQGIQRVRSLRR